MPSPALPGALIPLQYHYHMLSDQARLGAFQQAIAAVIQPGQVVLELGCGTGVLSFLAAQRARTVLAVELLPEMVNTSRHLLAQNGVADRVEVIHADAHDYLPPEPVDVVICEMLHSALLQESQLSVMRTFCQRYQAHFGNLPRFLPEATLLGVQLIEQQYDFAGYHAPVPLFRQADSLDEHVRLRSEAQCVLSLDYRQPLPASMQWAHTFHIEQSGLCNALRLITKHLLAILPDTARSIDWHSQYLHWPLPKPMHLQPGMKLTIRANYAAGAPVMALTQGLQIEVH
ncbi:methyltransferase domain-containing protein [Leeia sp.]|uniref:methyltransferase domain-containing protein n=1 Tax=Leeia sp. TaxID=2884678 RepID=UPI0035AEEB9C